MKKKMATSNQIMVANRILEQVRKGAKVSVSKAMRGIYSPTTSQHPQKLTKNKSFIKLLQKAGLTDEFFAKKHAQLANSSRLEEEIFDAVKKGKKWLQVSDEDIIAMVEGSQQESTGNKVRYIKPFPRFKRVFFTVPDNVVQSKALEMGYKITDKFAPDKLDIIEHEMSEEEKHIFDSIFKNNKK